eukprot:Protomagalhaensia_sp_Gyna_25__4832@NODE_499_length_3264_cov_94_544496_g390_i0_p2_GENE_NODE_499_length_3264_cov_94_544496_g390_i0NODE_499_length_3264_cov_94_544496_g390_i0_p2_ORF_typecomplete_len243_score24_88_NODE_499_length_3264_cov_94_544496_g390_i0118846
MWWWLWLTFLLNVQVSIGVITRELQLLTREGICPASCPAISKSVVPVGGLLECMDSLYSGVYPVCTISGRLTISGFDGPLATCYETSWEGVYSVAQLNVRPLSDVRRSTYGYFHGKSTVLVILPTLTKKTCRFWVVPKTPATEGDLCGFNISRADLSIPSVEVPPETATLTLDLSLAVSGVADAPGVIVQGTGDDCGNLTQSSVVYDKVEYSFTTIVTWDGTHPNCALILLLPLVVYSVSVF